MNVVAVRHVAFEDLGLLEPLMRNLGAEISYIDAWRMQPPLVERADLAVFLGGPISVNDSDDYPFLLDEIDTAKGRIAAGKPTLGICLGAQIITRAIGGQVRPGARKEIGWAPIELTEAGTSSALAALDSVPVLHWHGEVCEPPPGTICLAATRACAMQAFLAGPHALALQFHIEAGARGIEPWLIGHTMEIAMTPGVTVAGLRDDTERYGAALNHAAVSVFEHWLSSIKDNV